MALQAFSSHASDNQAGYQAVRLGFLRAPRGALASFRFCLRAQKASRVSNCACMLPWGVAWRPGQSPVLLPCSKGKQGIKLYIHASSGRRVAPWPVSGYASVLKGKQGVKLRVHVSCGRREAPRPVSSFASVLNRQAGHQAVHSSFLRAPRGALASSGYTLRAQKARLGFASSSNAASFLLRFYCSPRACNGSLTSEVARSVLSGRGPPVR